MGAYSLSSGEAPMLDESNSKANGQDESVL